MALAEQLLVQHYRFFVRPSATFDASGARERVFASDLAHRYFVLLFEALGTVLRRPQQQQPLSPRLCRQIVALLSRVDQAHGLFAFHGFQQELRMAFLAMLMHLLTDGAMNLLQDELVALLYRLASVDFASFYARF